MKDTRDMMVKDYDTCTDEELIARLRAGEREITVTETENRKYSRRMRSLQAAW